MTISLLSGNMAFGFKLVKNGKAKSVIVVPSTSAPVVQYAAKELNWHIKKASGVELQVIKENALPSTQEFKIYLGNCKATASQNIDCSKLPVNSFRIKSTPDALFLAGHDGNGVPPADDHTSMGTLFAVYEWLERAMGVKWLWPGELGTVVPPARDIDSGTGLDLTVNPPFIATNLRHRGNRRQIHLTDVWLRRHRIVCPVSLSYGHAYTDYWKRFGKTHPEYFAMRPDGIRAPIDKRVSLVQMCVSNSGLHKQIIKDWLKQKEKYPYLPWINGAENDRRQTDPPCQCKNCKTWDAAKKSYSEANPYLIAANGKTDNSFSRSLSDRYAKFWLALQQEGRKYDPDAKVVGYAYSNYTNPPVETQLNKNIIVYIVPHYLFPLFGKDKDTFRKLWDGWSRTGARLILRPNYFLEGYCMPYIYAEQFGNEFKYAYKNGMIGTDFDSLTGMWGVHGPNLYVLGRLHEKPEMEISEILDEYYSGFGPAAKEIREYFNFWQSITNRATRKWKMTHGGGWAKMSYAGDELYTPETFKKGFSILNRARKAAHNAPEALARVEFLSHWLEQARLAMNVLAKYHSWQQQRTPKLRQDFLAAKNELDEYRQKTDLGIVNIPFLKQLEVWAGWRGAAELKPKKMNNTQILASLFAPDDQRWKTQSSRGICSFGIDEAGSPDGKAAAFIDCQKLDRDKKSWARYYTDLAVEAGREYKLKMQVKTSPDFNGVVMIWPPGKPRLTIKPTIGKWQKITLKFVAAKSSRLYLNLWNGTGKVCFANLSMDEEKADGK